MATFGLAEAKQINTSSCDSERFKVTHGPHLTRKVIVRVCLYCLPVNITIFLALTALAEEIKKDKGKLVFMVDHIVQTVFTAPPHKNHLPSHFFLQIF